MSTLLDIPSLNIGDLQSEGITSLKEGIEVPSNCSVVKRKRKRNPNDKRTGWQFKRPAVRAKIDLWNEAQRLCAASRRQETIFAKLDAGARPSHVTSRDEHGRIKRSYERWVSIEGLEGQRQSGIRRARDNALKRKSPTAGLGGLEEYSNGHFRSPYEADTAAFLSLSGLSYQYAETSAAQPARSATINLQPTFRQDDFNNPKARNALGQMSHVWLVRMIHRSETGEYFAFVGDSCWSKVRNLVLRKSIGRLP